MIKKRLFSIVLAVIMGLSFSAFTPVFAAEKTFIKSVVKNDVVPDGYTGITSVEELNAVRNNLEGKYILMNDIDVASVTSWQPIGDEEAPFKGVFNGNGYSVSNITITDAKTRNAGLFGCVSNATVANVSVDNFRVNINYPYQVTFSVGAVAAVSIASNILNCSASGSVEITAGGHFYIGGIAGVVSGEGGSKIANCLNRADFKVIGKISDDALSNGALVYANVGGVVGVLNCGNSISRSINEGNIEIAPLNGVYAGGICAQALYNAPISDCANSGDIYVNKAATAGGICGQSHSLANCYNTGIITLENESKSKFGGIAGTTQFNMSRAIVSPLPDGTVPATVSNCYYIDEYETAISNAADGDMSSVKALSTEEFASQDSFEGFDFAKVWTIPQNAAPTLKYKTSEMGSAMNINGCDAGYTFELFGSIVYAASNNEEIVSIESNSLVKCNSSGTTSIDTINADGDFAVIEISVVCENEEEPKGIFDKIAELFASMLAWFIGIFN